MGYNSGLDCGHFRPTTQCDHRDEYGVLLRREIRCECGSVTVFEEPEKATMKRHMEKYAEGMRTAMLSGWYKDHPGQSIRDYQYLSALGMIRSAL